MQYGESRNNNRRGTKANTAKHHLELSHPLVGSHFKLERSKHNASDQPQRNQNMGNDCKPTDRVLDQAIYRQHQTNQNHQLPKVGTAQVCRQRPVSVQGHDRSTVVPVARLLGPDRHPLEGFRQAVAVALRFTDSTFQILNAPRPKFSHCVLRMSTMLLVVLSVFASADNLLAQVEVAPPEPQLENRTLSGTADFELGRHIGGTVSLGTLSISSNDLEAFSFPGITDPDPVSAHSINVQAGGFALLPNNILIRNESGNDLSFNSSNQTHDFEVYHLGSGKFDISTNLPSFNQYTNGSGDQVTAFGGNIFWEAQFNRLDGEQQTFAISDPRFQTTNSQISPLTLGPSRNPSETSSRYNLATSNSPIPAALTRTPDENITWLLSENQTATYERWNTLFEVDGVPEGDPQPTLDLSEISISASGTSLGNRRIGSASNNAPDFISTSSMLSLGRFISGFQPTSLQADGAVDIVTNFGNNQRTALTLQAFETTSSEGGLTVSLDSDAVFDADSSTASVNVSGTVAVNSTGTGTFNRTINVGSSIIGEGVLNETPQESLNIGVSYGVVENNSATAEDITVFKLEGVNSNGSFAINRTAERVESTLTHTAINVSQFAELNDSSLQTVNLSAGNGITGEGLDNETVTATVSYDIHQVTVEGSDLTITESGLVSTDSAIEFANNQAFDDSKLQAQAIVTNVIESGSARWDLDGLAGWDFSLDAGESLTLTPVFDDTGIDTTDTLGRNFRRSVTFQFQDGLVNLQNNLVEGTVSGLLSGESSDTSLRILGSSATRQEATYLFEQNNNLTANSGVATLVAGTTLQSEGINLTNTDANTSLQAGTPTQLRIIDSVTLSNSVELQATFTSLDNIDPSAVFAGSDTSGFFSDIVEINGLDGILHVIELSYEPEQGLADLLWFNEEDGEWVNAILGNSNIEASGLSLAESIESGVIIADNQLQDLNELLTELRFEGSYDDYLISLGEGVGPQLGAFGSFNGRAWAVVDHNSAFSTTTSFAVPEPSAALLLAAFSTGLFIRRRR